jgi:hypothetical protein
MKNLIEEVNEPLFKALSKNYLKLIKQKDPDSSQTLAMIQEDLARVIGYPNLHAAQAQWAMQSTPQYILENATPEEKLAAAKSIEWAFAYLENNFHVFSREKLLDAAVEVDKKIATTDEQKARWKILVGEAIKGYEDNIVSVRIPGGITTKKLKAKSDNLIHLARSHDHRRMLPSAAFQSPDTAEAIKSLCQLPSQLGILSANSDETKYAGMKEIKAAYEAAGFQVEITSPSPFRAETIVSNEVMGSKGDVALGHWLEKLGHASTKKPAISGPTVMLVDNADEVPLRMLEGVLKELSKVPEVTKVVLFSMRDAVNPHSTMQVLNQELTVFTLDPAPPKPSRSPRP